MVSTSDNIYLKLYEMREIIDNETECVNFLDGHMYIHSKITLVIIRQNLIINNLLKERK